MNAFIVPQPIMEHDRVNEILGADWLTQQVEAARNAIKKKVVLHPARMSPAFGWVNHPLVSEAKDGAPESRTPSLDSLEMDLADLGDIKLPSNISDRLKDDHDCSKVAYELRIAAGFARLGYQVTWLTLHNQPHPEFTVSSNDSNLMSVECKKRDESDGYEQDGAVFWKYIQYSLRVKMKNASLNYWVKITGRDFNLEDIDSLVTEIISVIQANEHGQFDSNTGRYHIEYTKLADVGESIPMEVVNMFPRGVFGINAGTQKPDQKIFGPLKNPKLLRLEVIDDLEHRVKGILRNLKTAAHQVIKGLPNLVYLDVNIPEYEKEVEEFGNYLEAARVELAQRHRQISAVVITNIYPALTRNNYLGLRIRTELIEHPNPLVKLPKGLVFPGDDFGTQWLPGIPSVQVS